MTIKAAPSTTAAKPTTGRVILGIETSCDETAASVVRTTAGGVEVLSNVIASQNELHAEYRGVVPEIASRAHAERILPIVREAVATAGGGLSLAQIDAFAVGNRPGLIGSLLVGTAAAKALAFAMGKPCIPVDHVHAHLYAGCMTGEGVPAFPAVGLVVSGGHTSIYLMRSPASMTRIAATIDDAIGEAYDKVAAIIGLGFPGGPLVDKLAQRGDASRITFPISRVAPGSLDFSFSGLKTAVLYKWNGVPGPKAPAHTRPSAEDLCASFQHAAIAAIIMKLGRALEQHGGSAGIKSLLVGGGVSANSRLRSELTRFAASNTLDLRLPPMDLCMDNAAMIAGLAAVLVETDPAAGSDSGFSAVPTTSL